MEKYLRKTSITLLAFMAAFLTPSLYFINNPEEFGSPEDIDRISFGLYYRWVFSGHSYSETWRKNYVYTMSHMDDRNVIKPYRPSIEKIVKEGLASGDDLENSITRSSIMFLLHHLGSEDFPALRERLCFNTQSCYIYDAEVLRYMRTGFDRGRFRYRKIIHI